MSQMSREQLLEVVRRVYDERDPMPEGLVERMRSAARSEAAGLGLDLELMLLVEESATLAGVRGDDLDLVDATDVRDTTLDTDQHTDRDTEGAGRGRRRGAGTAYTLRFSLGEVDLLVRVAPGEGDESRVDGWMAPVEQMTVRALSDDEPSRATVVSDSGRFEFADLPAGLLRLRFEPHDRSRPPFATPSFEI